ncbi:hypothetical protein ACOMHN_015114 [Nucella lapillus]
MLMMAARLGSRAHAIRGYLHPAPVPNNTSADVASSCGPSPTLTTPNAATTDTQCTLTHTVPCLCRGGTASSTAQSGKGRQCRGGEGLIQEHTLHHSGLSHRLLVLSPVPDSVGAFFTNLLLSAADAGTPSTSTLHHHSTLPPFQTTAPPPPPDTPPLFQTIENAAFILDTIQLTPQH